MKANEAVAARIQALCETQGITIHGLATRAGLSPSTLKNIIYGVSKNPGISTIKILCDGLGITLPEFFDAEIFRNLDQEIE